MKLNNKQKIIIYITTLFILLVSIYSKKYIIPAYKANEYKNVNVINNQVKIY